MIQLTHTRSFPYKFQKLSQRSGSGNDADNVCLICFVVGPVSEPNTKRCRVEEKDEEQEEVTTEHLVWPEPLQRVAPPVHTAALISKEQEDSLPEACQRLREISPEYIEEAEKIRLLIESCLYASTCQTC